MFQALEAFRGHLKSITVNVAFTSDGQQYVTVTPMVDKTQADRNSALAQPFVLKAAAQELDAGFVSSLSDLAVSHRTLAEQVAAQAAALNKPASKSKTSGHKADAADDVESEGDDASDSAMATTSVAAPVAAASVTPEPLTVANLFA